MAKTRAKNKEDRQPHNSTEEDNSTVSAEESNYEDSSDEDEQSVASPLFQTPTKKLKTTKKKSKSIGRTNQSGLSIPILKELAKDIEAIFGGLEGFKKDPYSTTKLCREKTDLYGVGGSPARQQVRDKLKQWKKLSEDDYKELLNDHLGIWTSEQAALQAKLKAKRAHTKQLSTKSFIAPLQQGDKRSSIKPIGIANPQAVKKPTVQNTPTVNLPQIMTSNNTFTIDVNTAHPEANREVMVYNLERIEGSGEHKNTLFKGFWMCLPIDIRFILDDTATTHWKARLFSRNTVLLSIQAWNYSHLHDRDEFLKANVASNCLEAIDGAHHDLEGEPSDKKEARKWKHLFLKFGDDVELSAKHINEDAGEDEKLKLELIPVEVTHPKAKNLKYTTMFAAWKIARTDLKANKKGKLEKKEDKSDAARLLDMMNGVAASAAPKPIPPPLPRINVPDRTPSSSTVVPDPAPSSTVVPDPTPSSSTVVPDPAPSSTVVPDPAPSSTVMPDPAPSSSDGAKPSIGIKYYVGDRKTPKDRITAFNAQPTSKESRSQVAQQRQQKGKETKLLKARQQVGASPGYGPLLDAGAQAIEKLIAEGKASLLQEKKKLSNILEIEEIEL